MLYRMSKFLALSAIGAEALRVGDDYSRYEIGGGTFKTGGVSMNDSDDQGQSNQGQGDNQGQPQPATVSMNDDSGVMGVLNAETNTALNLVSDANAAFDGIPLPSTPADDMNDMNLLSPLENGQSAGAVSSLTIRPPRPQPLR